MIFLVVRIITMMLGVIVTYLLLCYFISHTQSEHVLIRAHQRRVAAWKKFIKNIFRRILKESDGELHGVN